MPAKRRKDGTFKDVAHPLNAETRERFVGLEQTFDPLSIAISVRRITVDGITWAGGYDCVLGYSIGNDVSERVWQKSDRTLWRAKNTDTFKPMGQIGRAHV